MAGRHSRRRGGGHARIPGQRGPRPVGITDAHTQVEHAVTDLAIAAHRHSGRYLAVCGARVLAAALAGPAGRRCEPCGAARGMAQLAAELVLDARRGPR